MSVNLLRDAFTLDEAAKFLNIPSHRLGYAVIEGEIPCGVVARDWRGIAIPKRDDIPRDRNGHQWDADLIETVGRDSGDFIYLYRLKGTDIRYCIRTALLGQFWYLHHSDAYRLFAVERDGIDVQFLEPNDGSRYHAAQPDRFPEAAFTVFVESTSLNRRVTLADVLFLRGDLEKLTPKDVATRENTLPNIIGALVALFLDTDDKGKKLSVFKSQNEIVGALLDRCSHKPGISDGNLRKVFAAANNSLKES